jgi:DNA-binding transcriptional LysR family regulator
MRFFCRVTEAKSFSAAAVSLDVVPSALSKALTALEQELGFALLNRSTRGLSPHGGGCRLLRALPPNHARHR